MNAILEKDLMRVLESSTDQHERRARRADKLSEILAELEEAYGVGDKAKHFLQGNRAQRGGSSGGGGGGRWWRRAHDGFGGVEEDAREDTRGGG